MIAVPVEWLICPCCSFTKNIEKLSGVPEVSVAGQCGKLPVLKAIFAETARVTQQDTAGVSYAGSKLTLSRCVALSHRIARGLAASAFSNHRKIMRGQRTLILQWACACK